MAHKSPTKRVVDVRLTVLNGGSIPPSPPRKAPLNGRLCCAQCRSKITVGPSDLMMQDGEPAIQVTSAASNFLA